MGHTGGVEAPGPATAGLDVAVDRAAELPIGVQFAWSRTGVRGRGAPPAAGKPAGRALPRTGPAPAGA